MHRIPFFLITLILGTTPALHGQPNSRNQSTTRSEKSAEPTSRIEAFAKRRGRLVVTEEYLVTDLPDPQGSTIPILRLSAVIYYEAGKKTERLKGIEVEIDRGTGDLPGIGLLDLDSAAEIATAMAQLQALDLELSPKQSPSVTYTAEYSTPSGFKIGLIISREGRHEVVISTPSTSTTVRLTELEKLRAAFESAVKLASSK